MKKPVFIFFLTLISLFTKAQNWEPVGGGVDYYPQKGSYGQESDPVKAMCEYHGKLYIGGKFLYSGKRKVNSLACWDGKKIDTVGRGIDSEVFALVAYDKYLCIAGRFVKRTPNRTAGQGIVLWRDTVGSWTAMDNAFTPLCGVYSLFIYKGDLFAGGYFSYKSENCIAKWNGSSWDKVGNIVNWNFPGAGLLGCVGSMTAYNGELYVGGSFHMNVPDYDHYIASWDGKKWNDVESKKPAYDVPGLMSYPAEGIIAMAVYKSKLFVGGRFDTIVEKQFKAIAVWNDTTWSGIGNVHGVIQAMIVYNNKLYIGGAFDNIDGKPITNIACWDGSSWSAVAQGLESSTNSLFKGRVDALAIYKDELYAGGYFNRSGKTSLNNLARINLGGQKK